MKSQRKTTSHPKAFWWHNATQTLGALNDNLFKLIIVYALIAWSGTEDTSTILSSIGVIFALPYLLIAPIAGSFADRYSKRNLIVGLKLAEISVMVLGVVAMALKSEALLYMTMFLMSTQSAFFSPNKYGIIREQVGIERLSRANGYIQMFTFLGIIGGTVLAPELSLAVAGHFQIAALFCVLVACLGFYTSIKIDKSQSNQDRQISFNAIVNLKAGFNIVRKDGFLVLAVIAASVFTFAAAFIQLNILDYGAQHLGLSPEQSTRLFLLTAIGIGLGALLAGKLSGRNIEFGIIPIGAAFLSIGLLVIGLSNTHSPLLPSLTMPLIGFGAGLFIVPIQSFIQYRSPADQQGTVQALTTFVDWTSILLAGIGIYLCANVFSISPQGAFTILAFLLIGLTVISLRILPDFFVKFIVLLVTKCCYRLRVRGLKNLPTEQPALLVSNHVSLMDAVFIVSSQQRRIRMLMSRDFYENANWLTRKIVDLAQVILIHEQDNPKQILKSLKAARSALDEGYLVCIFAEGALTRTGMMRPFKPGFERIVKGTDYPIIPVYIGGAWNSVASYQKGTPQLHPLQDFRTDVSVHYGEALPSTSTAFEVQQAVSELSVEAVEAIKSKRQSLAHEFVKSARRNWKKLAIVDSSNKELNYGKILTAALILRNKINHFTDSHESRIGILLPAGNGSTLTNLALSLDRKVSVNLNYTASADAIRSAQDQCEMRTVITSRKFLERFPDLPLPENVIHLEDLLQNVKTTEKVKANLMARFAPMNLLLRKGNFDPDETATILFSSGSTAAPKGIQLSHHNLLSNIEAFRSVLSPATDDVLLSALPHFHSFGYTVTLWFPILSGITIASHTNPLEGEQLGKLAEKYKATILLSTPTFLMAYSRKIKPEQFANLRFVFAGAEKLQPRVADLFEKRFGTRPLEGYGATELSPVCAVSLPNVEIDNLEETGNRADRIGRTLPNVAIKIVHPETGETLRTGEEGMILIKGPNVMKGYLNNQALTEETINEGWYRTGDIGVMDEDGFFAITGRISRFSKIGGEMVSHGAIEEALQKAFEVGPDQLAVASVSDEKKGERIRVVHTMEKSIESIQSTLREIDIPNLWKPAPKDWVSVDALPLLGTGKLDFRAIKELAAA